MKGHNDAKVKPRLRRPNLSTQQKPSSYPTPPSAVKTEDLCQDMSFVEGQAHSSNKAAHVDLHLKHKSILMVVAQVRKKHWNLKSFPPSCELPNIFPFQLKMQPSWKHWRNNILGNSSPVICYRKTDEVGSSRSYSLHLLLVRDKSGPKALC